MCEREFKDRGTKSAPDFDTERVSEVMKLGKGGKVYSEKRGVVVVKINYFIPT